ncbi:MAG: hypothetical protein AB7S26_22570 [Sandaracinaceae bacterium]
MTVRFELKKIGTDAIEPALEKAERYRLLNDPEQAESICRDILAVAEDNQQAKRVLILALTDQFAANTSSSQVKLALDQAKSLSSEYERIYYEGIVHEREGRAYLAKNLAGHFAYECLHDAMDCFEKANELEEAHHDDSILRWNSCARTIMSHRLEPRGQERELPGD